MPPCQVRLHCWPFEMYMEEARRLRSLYGVSTIYLATDSKVHLFAARCLFFAHELLVSFGGVPPKLAGKFVWLVITSCHFLDVSEI